MREIKFRAWDTETKEMETDLGEGNYLDHGKLVHFGHEVIFMQFTGLKDKNGKEIYEGDIFKGRFIENDEIYTGECIFEDGHFCIRIEKFFKPILNSEYQSSIRELKVIGNIYENPELLKGGKE